MATPFPAEMMEGLWQTMWFSPKRKSDALDTGHGRLKIRKFLIVFVHLITRWGFISTSHILTNDSSCQNGESSNQNSCTTARGKII